MKQIRLLAQYYVDLMMTVRSGALQMLLALAPRQFFAIVVQNGGKLWCCMVRSVLLMLFVPSSLVC